VPAINVRYLLIALLAFAVPVLAQAPANYPSRPVRIVVPYPPGGNADIIARLMADQFTKMWSNSVIVENRAGAGGTVGTEHVANSAPDGYSLLLATIAPNATAPAIYSNLRYDPAKDFAYISPLTFTPSVLVVTASLPVKNVVELIAYARTNQGKLNYASPGVGITNHLAMELLLNAAGIQALHVPYKGSPQASAAVVSGEVQMSIDPVSSSAPFIKAGTVRPLAVAASARSRMLPDVPTMTESGIPGVVAYTWTGLAAPAGTPPPIIARIGRDTAEILKRPEMRERMNLMGSEAIEMDSDKFQAFIATEAKKWGDVARRVGAKIN